MGGAGCDRRKTREETHEKWLKLHEMARKGPVPTKHPALAAYLTRWLAEVIEPNREPTTYVAYEPLVRLYIIPSLGKKRLDKLTVRDVQIWLNTLPTLCTCCDQKKDHRRPENKRRCCAVGKCCRGYPARSTIAGIRRVLRSALGNAVREELISKNVAALTTLPAAGKTKKKRQRVVWGVDEARRFLEHLRAIDDPLYAAYVLILVLGLRRGEVLGLAWDCVDLGGEQLWISRQLNRVRGQLLHRETTKTDDSTASLPLLGLCVTALKHRQHVQEDAAKLPRRSGRTPISSSPRGTAHRSSRATSTGPSRRTAAGRACRRSVSTTPGTPAPRSWPPSTFILSSQCAACGTRRSR
ncbi:integrase [Streptosporangium saharense]|uniref:Integrase n=1 Tax=Streptosporangium saharense TaxID=1706840 RepID=A0A7W7QPU1_9ACTN|nr:site-specific integrase [Streptosporangium saharense]MBB4917438.1 integrase [Streptosporangium saharense]